MAVLLTLLAGFTIWGLGLIFLPDDGPEAPGVFLLFSMVVGLGTLWTAAQFVRPFFD